MANPPATAERPEAEPKAERASTRLPLPPVVVVIACLAGLTAFVCTLLGSISVGLVAGLAVLVAALALLAWIVRHPRTAGPTDGSRRRFLQVGLGGAALVGVGAALGRGVDEAIRPDAIAVQDAAAGDLGAEHMELVAHAAVWMYLERIPLVAYGPGVIEPGDSEDRVSLADLAPTTAELIGFDGWA